nr:Cro/CI family transcriptional regulator [Acinetobacter baumannii]
MNDAQLIDKLGGVTAVARLLGIAPSYLKHSLSTRPIFIVLHQKR